MKVAYVLNTYPQPSHSFIRREVKALEKQGVEVTRLAMRRPSVPLVDPQDKAEEARTTYVLEAGAGGLLTAVLAIAIRRPANFWAGVRQAVNLGRKSRVGALRHMIYLAEACFVAQACKRVGAQHMHAHFGTNSTTVALLAHAVGGPGYSFTVHGPEEFDAPKALALPEKIDNAAFTVAISQFGRSQLCRWASFNSWDSLKVVHCGIEPTAFADPAHLPDGPLKLVSIGRFNEQKGQMVLVDAMARLRSTHPKVHLTLVGDGELRPQLERAIASHGLGDSITLAGWLSEDGVNRALANAHALVMPSFAEGLPMVVMEAMASARPVIATYVAGTPELVLDKETGWLVPAGDVAALCAAIAEAEEQGPDALQAMGTRGRARVLDRHDVTVEAEKLLTHFQRAVARHDET